MEATAAIYAVANKLNNSAIAGGQLRACTASAARNATHMKSWVSRKLAHFSDLIIGDKRRRRKARSIIRPSDRRVLGLSNTARSPRQYRRGTRGAQRQNQPRARNEPLLRYIAQDCGDRRRLVEFSAKKKRCFYLCVW